MIQRILALAAGFLVASAVGGWGQEQLSPTAGEPHAAAAVRALTTEDPGALDRVPADFAVVMGYRPVLAPATGGHPSPSRADGGCSSPFGGTRYGFTPACRQHDLGYDLLRYADIKGQPLGSWARRSLDDRFATQTRARGHGAGGPVTAGIYTAVVRFNSWRQGYGAPVAEPAAALTVPAGAGVATAVLVALVPAPRRRHRPLLTPKPRVRSTA
jgi:hypothetical protein